MPDEFGAAMALVKADIGGNITVRILLSCVIMLRIIIDKGDTPTNLKSLKKC